MPSPAASVAIRYLAPPLVDGPAEELDLLVALAVVHAAVELRDLAGEAEPSSRSGGIRRVAVLGEDDHLLLGEAWVLHRVEKLGKLRILLRSEEVLGHLSEFEDAVSLHDQVGQVLRDRGAEGLSLAGLVGLGAVRLVLVGSHGLEEVELGAFGLFLQVLLSLPEGLDAVVFDLLDRGFEAFGAPVKGALERVGRRREGGAGKPTSPIGRPSGSAGRHDGLSPSLERVHRPNHLRPRQVLGAALEVRGEGHPQRPRSLALVALPLVG